jgi:NADH dehydrogenase
MAPAVVITGAFSYTGKYVAQLLLSRGYEIRTLTNHPPKHHPERPNPLGGRIQVFPYNFDRPDELRRSLEGASAVINTYWVRFPHGGSNFETAIQNSRALIAAARDAEVQRIVHVSIANPSLESQLGYYKGKAQVEQAVRESGLSYAILRPTVIFGTEDILINNIAWFVRRFPVFAIPGDGRYAIRPIYVEDMARLLADTVAEKTNTVRDAVGPESFSFEELVALIARRVGRKIRLVHVPISVAYVSTLLIGWIVRDVVLTWEEYEGLMANLLASDGPSAGPTRLSQWLAENGSRVGQRYASEVTRHFADTSAGFQTRRTQEGGRS